MTSHIHAYTAGLVDGEGSVTLTKGHKNEHRSPCISLTNTSQELVIFLKQQYGGTIVRQKTYKPWHKRAWVWKLNHRRALDFLELVLPYMLEREKVRRARMLVNRYARVTPRNGKYTPAMLERRLVFEAEFFQNEMPQEVL